MIKSLLTILATLFVIIFVIITLAAQFMFSEIESPYGVEETAARIQHNIQSPSDRGWKLSGLRDPAMAIAFSGNNTLPVLLVEACSTKYSKDILKHDETRILSILMPCTITIFKKDNGKTYIGLMNAAMMGKLFGNEISNIMSNVSNDQKIFTTFDPEKPAPPLIRLTPGVSSDGGKDISGC